MNKSPRRTERHSFLCKAVKRRSARCIGSVFAFLLGLAGASASDTTASAKHAGIDVDVPLRFEYALLERLLVTQLFTGAGDTLEVLNDPAGCSEAVLREPVLSSTDGLLEMQAMLSGRLGVGGAGSCSIVFNWQGRVGISGVPEIRDGGTALGFAPSRVRLLDPSGTPVRSNALASLADAGARTAFRRFQIDLKPQIQSVGDLLPEVLPRHSRQQLEALLRTVRITGLSPAAEAVEANISFRVDEIPPRAPSEDALSEEELARWEERWQLMDALLVMAVKHYAAATQLQELRDALLDALIESRYRLRDALTEEPNPETDTVRIWFLRSWEALAPTIRRIGLEQPGQEYLALLSVIAAADALEALDRLGPGVGLEISSDGLRRLARMINGREGDELLEYTEELDPQLRQILEESVRGAPQPSAWRWRLSPFPRAVAASADRLNSWAPKRGDLPEYLPMVGRLLATTAEETSSKRKLDPAYHELFRRLVLTAAWQESCWRHYVVSDDRKLVPLRSGSGDVGLMQVNERIWRGFYDQQRLRWDIEYNGEAGAEVLVDYLLKYALRKGEHRQPGGLSNLARASYAAYNGGPSQVARYRSADASAYGKKVDDAFWEKYQQVAAGNELAVSTCLGGNLSGRVASVTAAPVRPEPSTQAPTSDRSQRFTLQLGAFSSEEAAGRFIRDNGLGAAARIQRRSGNQTGQYLVLLGDYPTRAEGEAARAALAPLEPWLRPVRDL